MQCQEYILVVFVAGGFFSSSSFSSPEIVTQYHYAILSNIYFEGMTKLLNVESIYEQDVLV